jgi:hypothetical protein
VLLISFSRLDHSARLIGLAPSRDDVEEDLWAILKDAELPRLGRVLLVPSVIGNEPDVLQLGEPRGIFVPRKDCRKSDLLQFHWDSIFGPSHRAFEVIYHHLLDVRKLANVIQDFGKIP